MIRSFSWKCAHLPAAAVFSYSFTRKPIVSRRLICGVVNQDTETLVNQISRVLSDHRSPQHDLELSLTPFSSLLTSSIVERVLKRCKNLGFAAHRFFLWGKRIPNFAHSEESYFILVDVLGSSKQFPLLWDFLVELRDLNDDVICPKLFWLVFRCYCRAGYPVDAIRAFERMNEFDLSPNADDLDKLMHSLCKRKFVKEAQSFFDRIKCNFDVKTKTYSILVRGWNEINDTLTARKVFDEMIAQGCFVDVLAYNSLLETLCKGGFLQDASMVLEEMRSRGVDPDAFSYSIFIRSYCNSNDLNSVYKMLDRMKSRNLLPNTFTYNAVIKKLCKNEKVEEAYQLLHEMSAPDAWTYNTMLAYHCDHGEVNRASKLVSSMVQRGLAPDRHTYNMILKLLIRIGRFDRMTMVWETMGKYGFHPTVSTYSVMIHGLCKKRGKLEDACRYFEKMIDDGIPPYSSTIELLRSKHMRLGLRDELEVLACKMERSSSCAIQEAAKELRGDVACVRSRKNDEHHEINSSY